MKNLYNKLSALSEDELTQVSEGMVILKPDGTYGVYDDNTGNESAYGEYKK